MQIKCLAGIEPRNSQILPRRVAWASQAMSAGYCLTEAFVDLCAAIADWTVCDYRFVLIDVVTCLRSLDSLAGLDFLCLSLCQFAILRCLSEEDNL